MHVETDRCGPDFVQSKLPESLVSRLGPVIDGPFRPVCERHDACYRLGEKTQSWCDDRMRTEMQAICESDRPEARYALPDIGAALCRFQAGVYYGAINNTYGAYARGGYPGGEIKRLRAFKSTDAMSDDEVTICADVFNPTSVTQEYDVELHHADGRRIDREPDLYERNVRAGESAEFCVGTNGTPLWSLRDLSPIVHISIRSDTPENFAFRNDMVVVDTRDVDWRKLMAR